MGVHSLTNAFLSVVAWLSGAVAAWKLASELSLGVHPLVFSSLAQAAKSSSACRDDCQAPVRSWTSWAGSAELPGSWASLPSSRCRELAACWNADASAARFGPQLFTSLTALEIALRSVALWESSVARSWAAVCSDGACAVPDG